MIIVEIYIMAIDKVYDFKLDEHVPVCVMIEEIGSIICQKEQFSMGDTSDNFMLCKADNKKILSNDVTLHENAVKSGDRLILV